MTGTGEVTKKRVKEGSGEFPIDCPLNDTAVTITYRARPVRLRDEAQAGGAAGADGGGPWLFDSQASSGGPLTVDLGACGASSHELRTPSQPTVVAAACV